VPSEPITEMNISQFFQKAIISKIVDFATENGDWILDPFARRGTREWFLSIRKENSVE
jgi:hypothetical protein